MNGVSQEQILALVDRYDVNGDGKISYEEFLQFVRAHKPPIVKPAGSTKKFQRNKVDEFDNGGSNREQWSEAATDDIDDQDTFSIHDYSPKPMKVGKRIEKDDIDDETRSEASSTLDASNPKELENRLKLFLQNLKAYLVKHAVDTSKTRSTGTKPFCDMHCTYTYKHMSSLLLPSAKLISCVLHMPTHNNQFISSRSVSTLISLSLFRPGNLRRILYTTSNPIATQPSVKSSLQPVSVSVSVFIFHLFCIPTCTPPKQVGNVLSTVTLLWQMPS